MDDAAESLRRSAPFESGGAITARVEQAFALTPDPDDIFCSVEELLASLPSREECRAAIGRVRAAGKRASTLRLEASDG